jgi:hypothetical protein
MSEEAVIAALAVVGLLCELSGLGLVVRGIRSDRRAARAAEEGEPESDLTLAVGVSLEARYNIEGAELEELEERVERLEKRVEQVAASEAEVRDEVQDYVNRKLSDVEHAGLGRDKALRHFLRELLEGDLSNQLRGVILFGVGALLATLSSVWDVLAG